MKAHNFFHADLDGTQIGRYEDIDQKLREYLIANRDIFEKIKTIWHNVDTYAFPVFATVVSVSLFFLDLSENNTIKGFQITGAALFMLYTVCKVMHGLYTLYSVATAPNYNELQVRLTALYFATHYGKTLTGSSVSQQFIDWMGSHYDSKKTLSQNALTAQQKGAIT